LDDAEQAALARLSVFEGGFSLEAAEAVLGDDGVDSPWPPDLLRSLRHKSLVATMDGEERLRLLESIREYASEKLIERGEASVIQRRHIAYFLAEAEELATGLYGPGGAARLEDLACERHNLLAAARNAEPEIAARLILALAPAIRARGPAGLVERLLGEALQAPSLDLRLRARLLVSRGMVGLGRGRLKDAQRDLSAGAEAGALYGELRARALLGLGRVNAERGQLSEATSCHREGIDLAQRLAHRSDEGAHRMHLARVLMLQDCLDEAEAEYGRAIRLLERASDRWSEGEARARHAVFLLQHARGTHAAEEEASRAVEVLNDVGDDRGLCRFHLDWGQALMRTGRANEALVAFEQARVLAADASDRPRHADASAGFGWASWVLDRPRAAEHVAAALASARELHDRLRESRCLILLGAIRAHEKRWHEAEVHAREALAISTQGAGAEQVAEARLGLVRLLLVQRRLEEAQELLDAVSADAMVHHWTHRELMAYSAIANAMAGRVAAARALLADLEAQAAEGDAHRRRLSAWRALVGLAAARDEGGDDQAVAAARRALKGGASTLPGHRLALRVLASELTEFEAGRN